MSNVHLGCCNFAFTLLPILLQQWDQKIISNILMVCVLFHNMILEDENNKELEPFELVKDLKIK
jgi:hypothetical protein